MVIRIRNEKPTLEEELKTAKESLEFKTGKTTYFTATDGHSYLGTVIGADENHIYLKKVSVLDLPNTRLKEYMKISKNKICAQIYPTGFKEE